MLKGNWILIMLPVLCLGVVANAEPLNFFPTGDMELTSSGVTAFSDDMEAGISKWNAGALETTIVSPNNGGTQSMKLDNTWAYSVGNSGTNVYYPISRNTDYVFSFDYYTVAGQDIDIQLAIFDAAGNYLGIDTTGSAYPGHASDQWVTLTIPFTSHPGADNGYIGLGATPGTAYIDNVMLIAFPPPLPGDANRDGVVSAGDYSSIQAHFGDTGEPNSWDLLGDANLDGFVSAGDYVAVQNGWVFTGGVPASVAPEPTTLSLLIFGGVATFRRNKRS